ncbi:MAG: hypothetical protein ACI9Y7_000604 [Dokdonia sp.]|jgi:hypothetical protein
MSFNKNAMKVQEIFEYLEGRYHKIISNRFYIL